MNKVAKIDFVFFKLSNFINSCLKRLFCLILLSLSYSNLSQIACGIIDGWHWNRDSRIIH